MMLLNNLRDPSELVGFQEAVLRGAASKGGLYWPVEIPQLTDIEELLALDFVPRSIRIAQQLLLGVFSPNETEEIVTEAFNFPIPLVQVEDNLHCLELFHGPTLAFKDFGARFMAQVLKRVIRDLGRSGKTTILTATSGDTGAAVAHAFWGIEGIDVRVLYPSGRISALQEKLFCALGGNVRTFEVDGAFDDCQRLVKACFDDPALVERLGLTSANSINISRVMAQCFYYFEAVARCPVANPVICVPSGNFGNLTAGLLSRAMGLPAKRFIAATNANDVVPLFLKGGDYKTRDSVATLSNAMDVGAPNNWDRILALYGGDTARLRREVSGESLSDDATREAIRKLYSKGYLADPHTAVAYQIIKNSLSDSETGIFLSTAHPAKFKSVIDETLGIDLPLPKELAKVEKLKILSEKLPNELAALKALL